MPERRPRERESSTFPSHHRELRMIKPAGGRERRLVRRRTEITQNAPLKTITNLAPPSTRPT